MNVIDITSELKRFETHLENNPRTIFSAKFGDGKTYFLNEYIRIHKQDTLFIVLHPINYSVASNEDVFEYIKRDILVELSKEPDFREIDWKNVAQTIFDYDTLLEECEHLSDALPPAKALLTPFRLFKKIDDKYAIDKYFGRFAEMKGGIFEQDEFTAAIKATIERIQKNKRKCVLIIEDLDRIDPGHLFRILNVLGAHIDVDVHSNKFGFDNIVAVLDYQMTERIFHHFYGKEANYSGYMAKFISHNIFYYSINNEARKQLIQVFHKECGLEMPTLNSHKWYTDSTFTKTQTIMQKINALSVRDIVNVLDDIDAQYSCEDIRYNGRLICVQTAPVIKLLALFVRLDFKFTSDNLMQLLTKSRHNFDMLGDLVCINQNFNSAKMRFDDQEQIILYISADGRYYRRQYFNGGSYIRQLEGGGLKEEINNVLRAAYTNVHDCKPIA